MQAFIQACMRGEFNDLQTGVFLALMRMKGETVEELCAAAKVMRLWARPLKLDQECIDIVGTGGDGKNTFNVSTACSFVVAATGVPVAKHGNRSVSSRSGSADLLEQAGFNLSLTDSQSQTCVNLCNLTFLFAPNYHPAMQHARSARQQLGIRTLFNLLGPLIHPAGVKKQVVGVFSSTWLNPLAQVLAGLGSKRVLVLSSQDGLDEISITAPTEVVEYHQGTFKEWSIFPEQYGMKHASLKDITVCSAQESLQLIQAVLAGKQGPARDMVLLNSAAAIYCASEACSFAQSLEQAKYSLDSGKAAHCFESLRLLTQTFRENTNE